VVERVMAELGFGVVCVCGGGGFVGHSEGLGQMFNRRGVATWRVRRLDLG
jgi:hypothetical protein